MFGNFLASKVDWFCDCDGRECDNRKETKALTRSKAVLYMRNAGWRVGNKGQDRCPECLRKEAAARRNEDAQTSV